MTTYSAKFDGHVLRDRVSGPATLKYAICWSGPVGNGIVRAKWNLLESLPSAQKYEEIEKWNSHGGAWRAGVVKTTISN